MPKEKKRVPRTPKLTTAEQKNENSIYVKRKNKVGPHHTRSQQVKWTCDINKTKQSNMYHSLHPLPGTSTKLNNNKQVFSTYKTSQKQMNPSEKQTWPLLKEFCSPELSASAQFTHQFAFGRRDVGYATRRPTKSLPKSQDSNLSKEGQISALFKPN